MKIDFRIQQHNLDLLTFSLSSGDHLFLLGANGSGKSNLMHQFYAEHQPNVRRISAHRQTWFRSGRPDLTPQNIQDALRTIINEDIRPESRWSDFHSNTRPGISIYNLMQQENIQNRKIAKAVRMGQGDSAKALAKDEPDPLVVLSELLKQANIPIDISIKDDEVLATKLGSKPYSIAELSDGERNVVLIAADVLTAPPDTLVLIDEPERHLHRSIISPLLSSLFSKRSDCVFVISTHEVMLPVDNPNSKILLVRDCIYQNGSIVSWNMDLIDSAAEIDEEIKKDILGARRKIIFVEGQESSLDTALYSLIFPDVSVVAKGSCRDVESAVKSIRGSEQLHRLKAVGIIDNDGRTNEDIEALNAHGVYPIDHYSVESIYYDLKIQKRVTMRLNEAVGGDDPQALLKQAEGKALEAATKASERLAERAAERRLHEEFKKHIPSRKKGSLKEQINVVLNGPDILSQECKKLNRAIEQRDLATIIQHYPVRDSGVLNQIATALGFKNRRAYEEAVLKLLKDDKDILQYVRGLLDAEVITAMSDNHVTTEDRMK